MGRGPRGPPERITFADVDRGPLSPTAPQGPAHLVINQTVGDDMRQPQLSLGRLALLLAISTPAALTGCGGDGDSGNGDPGGTSTIYVLSAKKDLVTAGDAVIEVP